MSNVEASYTATDTAFHVEGYEKIDFSLLIVDGKGEMEGSVSGGCIEGAVIREALACMEGAPPQLLEFGVSNEQAWDVGLACGGRVQVYVEAVE